MMLLSRDDLQTLLDLTEGPAISIFLPTERRGVETQQNPIRFKNLLREAERQLAEMSLEKPELEELTEPLWRLVDDHEFWQHQDDGLAVFRTAGFFETYRFPMRFAELSVVNERFYLKPLFSLLRSDGRFYILALSLRDVRLFEASHYSVQEIEIGPEVPRNLGDAVGYELEEQHLQYHSGNATTQGGAGSPIYHGQGGGEDDQKEEIRRFFHLVDRGIQKYLVDRGAPLVLAAVESQRAIFRQISGHPNLVPEGVSGNPERMRPEELRDRAWGLVEPVFSARCAQQAERFQELVGKGRASSRLDEVLPAAFDGRVETLFVARGQRRWGWFDAEKRQIRVSEKPESGSDDLLELAAVRTYVNGGQVYSLEGEKLPEEDAPVAAIFRY